MKPDKRKAKVGVKFTDMFGEYEVVGEAVWFANGPCYVHDVRTPEGWIVTMSAAVILASKGAKEVHT
jgi:hypothetical protein